MTERQRKEQHTYLLGRQAELVRKLRMEVGLLPLDIGMHYEQFNDYLKAEVDCDGPTTS